MMTTMPHRLLTNDEVAEWYGRFGLSVSEVEWTELTTPEVMWRTLLDYPVVVEHVNRKYDHTTNTWPARMIRFHLLDGTGFQVEEIRRLAHPAGSEVTVKRFAICKHEWDPSKTVDTRRGWHERTCAKCGYHNTWDSGD